MRNLTVIGIALASALTLSCTNKVETQKEAAPKVAKFAALRVGPKFIELMSCQDIVAELQSNTTKRVSLSSPVHQFVINIKHGDPHSLDRDMTKDGGTNGLDEDFGGGKKPTKWDFDADLRDPIETATTKEYQSALLTIDIKKNSKVRFESDPKYVLRAGSEGSVAMFCDPTIVDADTVTLTIFRAPEAGVPKGSFNLGLVVEDKDGQHETPVFYDPEVKNDG